MSAGGVTRQSCRLKSSRGDVGFKEKIVTCAGGVVMGRLPPLVPNGRHVSAVPFIAVTAVKRVLFFFLDMETQLCVCAVAQMEQFTLVKAVKRRDNTRDRHRTDMVGTPGSLQMSSVLGTYILLPLSNNHSLEVITPTNVIVN